MNNLLVFRTVGGFLVRDPAGNVGSGTTWMEALGALIAVNPAAYNINSIVYNNDITTKNYLLERDLPRVIVCPTTK